MNTKHRIRLHNKALSLAAIAACVLLVPVQAELEWNSGTATFTFVHGDGSPNDILTIDPPESMDPPMQFVRDYSLSGLEASAQGGVSHFEVPAVAGFVFPCGTGVAQTDNSGLANANGLSSLNISGSGLWDEQSIFGPTLYGMAFFPNVHGTVAASAGSLAGFALHAEWGPDAFRSILEYNYTITTPGDFAFSFLDLEETVPNFLMAGEIERIAFSLTFEARGIDGLSEIHLGCLGPDDVMPPPAPGSDDPRKWPHHPPGDHNKTGEHTNPVPVPEPSTYALAGVLVLTLAIYRRFRGR